jgi:hypothetical protein
MPKYEGTEKDDDDDDDEEEEDEKKSLKFCILTYFMLI